MKSSKRQTEKDEGKQKEEANQQKEQANQWFCPNTVCPIAWLSKYFCGRGLLVVLGITTAWVLAQHSAKMYYIQKAVGGVHMWRPHDTFCIQSTF